MNPEEIENLFANHPWYDVVDDYNQDDVNPVSEQDKTPNWNENQYYETLIPMLKEYEAYRGETYIPTKGDKKTIGYGHTGEYAVDGGFMSKEKANEVLHQDAKEKTALIKSKIPQFDEFPLDLATQLGQSAFRGGITGSPDTIDLINEGDFQGASKEFLNNDEYREAAKRGRPGIGKRMEAVSNALAKPGTGVTPAANLKGGTL